MVKLYQLMVEGFFIRAPELEGDVGGFQSTFFVRSGSVGSSVDRVRLALSDRMSTHGVASNELGFFRTYCSVRNVWEVSEERMLSFEGRDLGFTFFRIGPVERVYLASRRVVLSRFRPQRLVCTPP